MSSSKPNMQPKKLLDNHEEAFKKIFGRFMFNIEHIEKNYCNINSGLVYDPKTDKVLDCSINNELLQISSNLYKNDPIGVFYARNRLYELPKPENASLTLIQGSG